MMLVPFIVLVLGLDLLLLLRDVFLRLGPGRRFINDIGLFVFLGQFSKAKILQGQREALSLLCEIGNGARIVH
jgi:hypothetical protein